MSKFFELIEKLRSNDIYKNLNSGLNNKANIDLLKKYFKIQDDVDNVNAIVTEKQIIKSNVLHKPNFLSYINNVFKVDIKSNIEIPDFVEFPQIDTNYMLTINFLKLRGLLTKLFSAQGVSRDLINEKYLDIQKHILSLMDNQVLVSDFQVFPQTGDNVNFINLNLSENLIKEYIIHLKNLIDGNICIGNHYKVKYMIDYSSPNVAKQMTVGHLRSTLLGLTFKNLFEKKGGSFVVGINHYGDWGEQFGKIFYSMINLSQDTIDQLKIEFESNPNQALFKLYVSYKQYFDQDENSKEMVKYLFTLLSQGDELLLEIWSIIRSISLLDFQNIYERMGVKFESEVGEAFFEIFIDEILADIEKKGFLVNEDGDLKVYVKENPGKVFQILKANEYKEFLGDEKVFQKTLKNAQGVTNYLTRDIAALKYRKEMLGLNKFLYLTGAEQIAHFEVLQTLGKALGFVADDDFVHIPFGLYLKNGKKMSSRDGNVLKLSEVFESVDNVLQDKVLSNSAIFVNDLKQQIHKGVEFDPEMVSNPYGDSGVYLLYTAVRWKKLLNDLNYNFSISHYDETKLDENFIKLLRKSISYETAILTALNEFKLNGLFNVAFDIAHILSSIYGGDIKFNQIKDEAQLNAYLCVIYLGVKVLEDVFSLVNISLPDEIKRN